MNKTEKIFLKDLYESVDGLYAFTLHSRYKVEPSILFNFIGKYSKKGILKFENDKIELTEEGKKIILKQLFFKNTDKGKFDNIPDEFKYQKIEINSPYLPNINNVSAEILNMKKVE